MRENVILSAVGACAVLAGLAKTPVCAQSNSTGPNSRIVVGTLKSISDSGSRFDVLQQGKYLRKLSADENTIILYVGLPKKADHEPTIGYGVKASCGKCGRLKRIVFTPPLGDANPLGIEELLMTVNELFAKVDGDGNRGVGYIEFSVAIDHSPKHGPDTFRKADKDSDGELSKKSFPPPSVMSHGGSCHAILPLSGSIRQTATTTENSTSRNSKRYAPVEITSTRFSNGAIVTVPAV